MRSAVNRLTCAVCVAAVCGIVTANAIGENAADSATKVAPLVRVEFTDAKNKPRTISGQILVEAQDGGILLLGRDAVLTNVTPQQLKSRTKTGDAFKPYNAAELGTQLQAEFGNGFRIHTTKHYVICSDAGAAYAKWCGALFERILGSFHKHWDSADLKLHDPEFPLVAIVFNDRKDFARYATADPGAGPAVAEAPGYYSIRSNRMVLFDLSAIAGGLPAKNARDVLRKIRTAPFNVATVIHEATHQIAYNSGTNVRYADNPLWLAEGMAMYYESPDFGNRHGWSIAGRVNKLRLRNFKSYAARRRKPTALIDLISNDNRFANAQTQSDTYAESWALAHFLIKTKRKKFRQYLAAIAKKPRLIWDKPEMRIAEFKKAFGDDLKKLDERFLKYVSRLR